MRCTVLSCLIILALCAVYETKHTLYVANVYPNNGEYVTINQFSVEDFSIGTFNVGTLNANSKAGVNITSSSSITLKGASVLVGGSDVSVSTSSSNSVVSIDASATLDVYGGSVTFKSAEGDVLFQALTSFELISTGNLTGSYSGFYSVGGDQVELQSSKGGSNFHSFSNINSQATTTFFEGGNLITFDPASFEVSANLAIDVFTSNFEAELRSLSISAFRNNILLQTGTLLDVGGFLVNMNANDLITIRSVESQVILLSEFDGSYLALDTFTIDSDSEVTFSADNGDMTVNAGDTLSIYSNEGVAIQSTSLGTFSMRSTLLSAFGESVVVQSTNSDVTYAADTFTASAFALQSITAERDLIFSSLFTTTINGNAGINLYADRETLSFASSPSVGSNAVINLNSDFGVTLSGTSVLINPRLLLLTSQNNVRFATSEEDRLSEVNFDITNALSISSAFILFSGGEVATTSPFLTLNSANDMTFTATENQIHAINFNTYNQTDRATADLTFNSHLYTVKSSDNTTYSSSNEISIASDDYIFLRSNDMNFNIADNITFTSTLLSEVYASSNVIIGKLLAAQIQVDSGSSDLQSTSQIISVASTNITVMGTNVNFDADGDMNFGTADSLSFNAARFLILSGTQSYTSSDTITFNATNILLQSPANQDIQINSNNLIVNGDTTFAGRDYSSTSTNLQLTTANTITIATDQEDSIVLDVFDALTLSADDHLLFRSSEDISLFGGAVISFTAKSDYTTTAKTMENLANTQSYNQSTYSANSPSYVSATSATNLLVAGTQNYTTSNTFFTSRGVSNLFTANAMNFQSNGTNSQISIESAINTFTSGRDISFSSGNFEISEASSLNIVSTTRLDFTTTNDLVFFGAEFDISAIGALNLVTPQSLTIAAAVISFDSKTNLNVSSNQIALEAGLHKTLTLTEGSAAGSITVESNEFILRSNNELNFLGSTWTHTSANADSNGAGISFKTYAMSSSILFTASSYSESSMDNNLFVVDDVTNRGGDDINLYSDTTATFTVSTNSIISSKVVNPVPGLPRALSQGMFFHASGSEYDPTLGYNVGMLLRTEGAKAGSNGGTVVSSDRSIYFTAGTYNDHLSHNGQMLITGKTNVNYHTGLDLDVDSQKSSATFTAGDSNLLTVAQTSRIESVDDTDMRSGRYVNLIANQTFEVVAEYGGVQINLDGFDETLNTASTSFNLEGGGNGAYNYGTDSYTATAITLYAFSKSSFSGKLSQTVKATRHIYYESSPNNDISFNADTSFLGAATAGSVLFDAGVNTNYHALHNTTLTAANDVTFFTKGSFHSTATKLLTLSSVTNQIYTGVQRVYYESLGNINFGAPNLVNTPIINLYAGGNTLRDGVDLTASGNFFFNTSADTSIVAKNMYTRSSGASSFESDASIYLQSTSTNSIGKDVFFKAAESMDIESNDTLALNAKVIKFEYDSFTSKSTGDSIVFNSARALSLSGASYSSTSTQHTLSAKSGVSITSSGDVSFTAKTAMSYTPKSSINWQAYGQIELDATNTLAVTATGTNANVYFQTKDSDKSFILLHATNGLTFASNTKISIEDTEAYVLLATGNIGMSIGDSITGNAAGDLYISSHTEGRFFASESPTGSHFEVSSTGTMYGTVGKSMTVASGRNTFFEPDIDLVFSGGADIDATGFNRFDYKVSDSLTLTTANNYNAYTLRTLYTFQTFDMVSTGINPQNTDGLRFTTTGVGSNIYAEANGGNVLTSAIGDININADNAVTLTASGVVQLLSKTGAISFNTIDVNTPIQIVAGDLLELSGKVLVDLSASGVDTGSGYIDIHAAGYKNLGNVSPIVNGTIGVGFFAKDSSIKFSADDSSVRMDSLNHFAAIPSVNGTLLVEANGQSRSGVGINVESTIIAVFSELDVAFEAANIGFFDYGISLYDYDVGVILPESVNVNRPTISSSKDQTYVAYGHNSKGNAIELITSVPNAPITFDTGYVNFYSGGSLLFEGEISQNLFSLYQTVITSASSVILEGNGLDTEDGVYLTTRVGSSPPLTPGYGSNIEFFAGIDAYIGAAGRIISEATTSIYFVTGTAGSVNVNFDQGASFTSPNGDLSVTSQNNIQFFSLSDLSWDTETLQVSGTNLYFINGYENGDSMGDVVFGDPTQQQYYSGIGLPNINFSGDTLDFISTVVDMANTVDLEIPVSNTRPACGAGNEHQVYIYFDGTSDNICSCVGGYEGWTSTAPVFRNLCFAFSRPNY